MKKALSLVVVAAACLVATFNAAPAASGAVRSYTGCLSPILNAGDLPVSDIVRDDATHTLYVGTDFGVLQGNNDGASWHTMEGMPRYEVMHLEMQPSNRVATCTTSGPCKRVLYAATHSRGIWKLDLKP